MRLWITIGSLMGLLAVASAAIAAHAVSPDHAPLAQSAVQMQGWHALALLATGLWQPRGGRWADAAGTAFTIGTILFAAGVWSKALDGPNIVAIAPWGGSTLMLGWALLAISAIKARTLPAP